MTLFGQRLRVGLGCMRLDNADPIHAALDGGVTVFDTARAYPGNEALLSVALKNHPAAFIITKGGMARPEGGWRPDGRAQSLRDDAEAGVAALGRPSDLFLIHAPDPRVEWATTVRALARLEADGLTRAVGLSNVALWQLDEALDLAPIKAVQVAWNALDDSAVRSGVIARCLELNLAVIAHSPLGGPRRASKLLRSPALVEVAARHHVTPAALLRLQKELELPTRAEGFTSLETKPFTRTPRAGGAGRFVALEVRERVPPSSLPTLHFAWQPEPLAAVAVCIHGDGPPACWCRPPLPGLLLAFCFERGLDPSKCELHGVSETHRVMAAVIGAKFVEVR